MDSVFFTGGAGFIGSHAAAYYDDRGVDVTALDNLSRVETLEDATADRDTAAFNWRYLANNHPTVSGGRATCTILRHSSASSRDTMP
jgi:CDP-paratose 2-epimerase